MAWWSKVSSDPVVDSVFESMAADVERASARCKVVDLACISPDPDSPRRTDLCPKSLAQLAESIRQLGVIHPISLVETGEGRYVIISGLRRYHAAQLAGLTEIPSIVFAEGSMSCRNIRLRQLAENLHRDSLSPVDAGLAFRSLMESEGWTAKQLAEALSVSPSLIYQRLKLLELPDDIQAKVRDSSLPGNHAYRIAQLQDVEQQRELVQEVESKGLNRQETIEAVTERQKRKPRGGRPALNHRFKLSGNVEVTIKWSGKDKPDLEQVAAELMERIMAERRTAA